MFEFVQSSPWFDDRTVASGNGRQHRGKGELEWVVPGTWAQLSLLVEVVTYDEDNPVRLRVGEDRVQESQR